MPSFDYQVIKEEFDKIQEERRARIAKILLSSGIAFTPSDLLQDHHFIVSRGIFNAALRMCKSDDKSTT